jgi:hypothetical protein
MRGGLSLVALVLCGVLWLVGLWLGRPWPVQISLGLPGVARQGPVLQAEARVSDLPGALTLHPRAGSSQVTLALACVPTRLAVHVAQAFGSRRGLDGLALGWRGREDGYAVLAREGGTTQVDMAGRGLAPGPALHLTSLGGVFDGSGTLEVTPVCDK